MISQKTTCYEIKLIDELVFKPCHLLLKNIEPEPESQEYAAHTFHLNEYKVVFRKAKITPTKTGQFVSIWKRNEQGITTPFDIKDDLDFLMIVANTPTQMGVFIFPKNALHEYRILSDEIKDGKRGIRVYPIWDETASKQAQKTQAWQLQYFLDLSDSKKIDLNHAKKLLTIY